MKPCIERFRRRAVSLLMMVGIVVVVGAATASTSSAKGFRLPTKTQLSTSSSTLSVGQSATITATVIPGVLVLSHGSVAFTDTTNNTALGTARPTSRCLLVFKPCTMTIVVPASSLAAGANTISGTYSGDLFEAPSTGTVVVTLNSGTTTTPCVGPCNTGTQTSSDGSSSYDITSTGTNGSITAGFTTTPLPCSTSGVGSSLGDVVVFSSTGLTTNKVVYYDVYGSAADTLYGDYPNGPNLCYDSPVQFETINGSPATPDGSGGYYGLLHGCDYPGDVMVLGQATNPPCVAQYTYTSGATPEVLTGASISPGESDLETVFETNASDPRASN